MKLIKSLNELDISGETAVALGFFDGVHRAHTAVLKGTEGRLPVVAFTFSTLDIDAPNKKAKLILTENQRAERLFKCGADFVLMPKFSEIFAISCEDFFNGILLEKLHTKVISCGYDYTFGAGAAGNAETLMQLCEKSGVKLNIAPKMSEDGEPISSSRIRLLLQNGEIKKANEMLGFPYYTSGKVVYGRQLGGKIGFPTINQELSFECVELRRGVYKTTAEIGGRIYKSMTNIGVKPTVEGERPPSAESHIFDYSGDLYGQTVKISYLDFVRDEKKFSSIDELKAQIALDKSEVLS